MCNGVNQKIFYKIPSIQMPAAREAREAREAKPTPYRNHIIREPLKEFEWNLNGCSRSHRNKTIISVRLLQCLHIVYP